MLSNVVDVRSFIARCLHPRVGREERIEYFLFYFCRDSGAVVAEKRLIVPNALTTLALIDRNICLVRDLDPALGFQTHQVSELLRSHGFGFGALA